MNGKSRLLDITARCVKLAYVLVFAGAILFLLASLGAAFFPQLFNNHGFRVDAVGGMKIDLSSGVDEATWRFGIVTSYGAGSVSAVAMLYILGQLRRLLAGVAGGAPFSDDSAARVRRIGWVVISLALLDAVCQYAMGSYFYRHISIPGIKLDPVMHIPVDPVLLGLLIICLAEVFRHGARLQEEHDLTV